MLRQVILLPAEMQLAQGFRRELGWRVPVWLSSLGSEAEVKEYRTRDLRLLQRCDYTFNLKIIPGP